jgi:putative PIG3 family NAD(P)H quinone oxidoreductase
MRAIQVVGQRDKARLALGEAPDPAPGAGEISIDVETAAVNRADLLQRRGLYPPPPGASSILGLECAGRVASLGEGVDAFEPGDRVMALLAGGGYAERAVVHAGSVLHVPDGVDMDVAGALPEVFLTCHLTLFDLGHAQAGETVLVHGGGSGIGTAAIQLLTRAGARVIVTAGNDEKCARCRELGAQVAVNYRNEDFVEVVQRETDGHGVDLLLDSIGGAYFERNLRALARGGRLVLIGLMGGASAEINLGAVLSKHLSIIGSTLRSRPAHEKAALVRSFWSRFGTDVTSGKIAPVIDRVLPLARAQEAHEHLEASAQFGKVVLRVHDS